MEAITTAVFLSVVANRIIEFIFKPIKEKYTTLDLWWLIYVSAALGMVLALFAGVDLFSAYFAAYPIVGKVLTAILVGGGANLIDSIFGKSKDD